MKFVNRPRVNKRNVAYYYLYWVASLKFCYLGLIGQAWCDEQWVGWKTYCGDLAAQLPPCVVKIEISDLSRCRTWILDNSTFDLRGEGSPDDVLIPTETQWTLDMRELYSGELPSDRPTMRNPFPDIAVELGLPWYAARAEIDRSADKAHFCRVTIRPAAQNRMMGRSAISSRIL